MFTKDLVTIITPNYNCDLFIKQTIESVLSQTYSKWELIIVDDCSTDNSIQIASTYVQKDSRIKIIQNETNKGAAFSRNKALDIAQGEYIAFLDSDDLWEKDKLEKQILFMKEHNCDFCFTRYDLIDEENKPVGKNARIPKTLTYWKLLHHDFIGCLTAIYCYDFASNIRSFDIKNNNDYGLFLQVVRKAKNAMGINETLAHYRIRKHGISRNKLKKVKPFFELFVRYLHIPFIATCWFLSCNIIIGKFWKHEYTTIN